MRDFSNDAIAGELHAVITTRHKGAVSRIAGLMGLSYHTVYDRLVGRIKINLPFLHAAVIATDDPDVKKWLEPQGYELRKIVTSGRAMDPEKELTDVILAAGDGVKTLRAAMADGKITKQEGLELEQVISDIEREFSEARLALRALYQR